MPSGFTMVLLRVIFSLEDAPLELDVSGLGTAAGEVPLVALLPVALSEAAPLEEAEVPLAALLPAALSLIPLSLAVLPPIAPLVVLSAPLPAALSPMALSLVVLSPAAPGAPGGVLRALGDVEPPAGTSSVCDPRVAYQTAAATATMTSPPITIGTTDDFSPTILGMNVYSPTENCA